MTDAANNRVTEIRYDLAGREMEREIREGSEQKYLHDLTYDACGNLVRMGESVSGASYASLYDYDSDDRLVKSYYGTDAKKTTTSYDALGRVSSKTHYVGSGTGLSETFSYHAGASAYGANAQSALISGITTPNLTQSYEYDANGNITSFTLNGQTCTYAYDDLGQLIRVNDPMDTYAGSTGTTWVYTYDRGGNITARKVYAYTTGELGTQQGNIAFGYDSVWKDKLTKYLSYTIESDALGNVTKDNHWEFEWEGRRLVKMTGGLTAEFEYDENGQRIRKTSNGVVTNYTVQGKRIVHVNHSTLGDLHIYYDRDRPDAVDYKGTMYGYVYSLQGDVLGLRDSTGALVVEYRYDAWGRQISKTGSKASNLGTINPFRYRGYVLDEDVGLYYLRSRYYNPWWGRFISADAVLGQIGGLLQHNLWAYCCNSPLMHNDVDGKHMGVVEGENAGGGGLSMYAYSSTVSVAGGCFPDKGIIPEWFKRTFGFAKYQEVSVSKHVTFNLPHIANTELGVAVTYRYEGDDTKPIVFYSKTTADANFGGGIMVNVLGRQYSLELSSDGLSFDYGSGNTSRAVHITSDGLGYTVSKIEEFDQGTKRYYETSNLRPEFVVLCGAAACVSGGVVCVPLTLVPAF